MYQDTNSTYRFKLVWPSSSQADQQWEQTSNPMTSSGVTGYQAVDAPHSGMAWGGLALSSSSSALLDGSANSGNWFYAVGTTRAWRGGIPGPVSTPMSVTELYVWHTSIGSDLDTANGVEYALGVSISTSTEVVLIVTALVEADCCLCTAKGIAAWIQTYKQSFSGDILGDVTVSACYQWFMCALSVGRTDCSDKLYRIPAGIIQV